jgi:hypothetical protein
MIMSTHDHEAHTPEKSKLSDHMCPLDLLWISLGSRLLGSRVYSPGVRVSGDYDQNTLLFLSGTLRYSF